MTMKHPLAVLAVLVVSASAFAQSPRVIPAGFGTKEGAYYSSRFGTYRQMRMQFADGEFGRSAAVVKGLGLRADGNYGYDNVGRIHQNMKVYLSGGNYATFGANFSKNVIGTPTLCYDGPMQMDTNAYQRGPRPFNTIPFSSTYMHTGKDDLLIDTTMIGGILANNITWTSTGYHEYRLDSVATGSYGFGHPEYHGNGWGHPTNKAGCKDSKSTSTDGPYAYTYMAQYGPTYATTSWRGKTRAYGYGSYFPPSTNIAFVMGVPNPAGVSFPGVACNKVHVTLNGSELVFFAKSATSTATYTDCYNYLLGPTSNSTVPTNAAWIGTAIMTQAAFSDSVTGALCLSRAGRTDFPPLPLLSVKRMSSYTNNLASPTGIASSDPHEFPITRYTL